MSTQPTQPEALRLAEQYDHGDPAAHGNAWKVAVCNELRRLHALTQGTPATGGEPLTDEEIADFVGGEYHHMTESELRWFRLGEAAHGITRGQT